MTGPLTGRRIAVPESRELDLFAAMLERQGATAMRCPLVAIRDVEDAAPVEAWLGRLAAQHHDVLVLMTGEGVTRLIGFAERAGMKEAVLAGMNRARKMVRGPKPARALRQLGLAAEINVEPPTSAGVAAALARIDLSGRSVGVQLYPGQDQTLADAIHQAGGNPDPVLCYRYAAQEEDASVLALLHEMAAGRVDLIAFTSTPQIRRLEDVARHNGGREILDAALRRTRIAAIGPLTAAAITERGFTVSVAPERSFHLKPLLSEIAAQLMKSGTS